MHLMTCPNCEAIISKAQDAHITEAMCIKYLRDVIHGFNHSMNWKQKSDEEITALRDQNKSLKDTVEVLKDDCTRLREEIRRLENE